MKTIVSYTAAATLLSQSFVFGETEDYGSLAQFDDTATYDYSKYMSDNCQSTTTTGSPDTTDVNSNDNNDDTNLSSQGQDYEEKYGGDYSNYYSKYYTPGADGDGGYDLNNDGPNGAAKSSRIMCKCAKETSSAKNANIAFSKCMNDLYGNNAKTWEEKYAKYINQYQTSTITESDNNRRGGRRHRRHNRNENNNNQPNEPNEPNEPNDVLTSTESPEVNNNNNNEAEVTEIGENGFEPSDDNSEYLVKSGLNDETNGNTNESFTHSDYMSYLAIFLLFVGAILFVLAGVNCWKYTWKTYKLRNYEAIGENGVKTDELQNNKLVKHDRIRLPRKQPRRVETLDESNNMKYYDERSTYTIGDV